jgi:hypothetical protein
LAGTGYCLHAQFNDSATTVSVVYVKYGNILAVWASTIRSMQVKYSGSSEFAACSKDNLNLAFQNWSTGTSTVFQFMKKYYK